MALKILSGASTDELTIDATSKAARVTPYSSSGRELSPQSKNTFFAAGSFTPVATPTDLVTIFGSASKIVRVSAICIGTTNTATGSQEFFLTKRSSANTGGTFVAGTPVNADSTDAVATAIIGHYTANAATLGTAVGNINIRRVASPAAKPASFAGIVQDTTFNLLEIITDLGLTKRLILNGIAQGLCINFAGAALVAGQTHIWNIIWTEE